MSDEPQPTDRRDFLLKLGAGAGVAAITVQAGASLRSLVPNVPVKVSVSLKKDGKLTDTADQFELPVIAIPGE